MVMPRTKEQNESIRAEKLQTAVTVLIPVYRLPLTKEEKRSLDQAYTVLHAHPITVVKPASVDLDSLLCRYPDLRTESFDDSYFTGIDGYNRLMMTPEFYARFLHTEYILIHQLDAWVFRDELRAWCDRGYDYIGAPWLEKPVYRLPLIAGFMRMRHACLLKCGKHSGRSLYNKVGNGGLSLRKVASHYKASRAYRDRIASLLRQKRSSFHNEDVFWATEIPEFTYPDTMEALLFSFDKYPSYCYKLTGKQLPFGCHGWYKRKMKRFWKPIIHSPG